MFRSAFPLSSLKIATKAQVSKKPRDEGANCSETQESAAGPSLVLPMQELDPCIADWRHRFVCFDELQEMHSAKMISGNNCSPIRSDSAFRHGILSGESGRLLSALQVPKPQRLVHRSRHGSKPIGRYHHGPDPVRMACERAQCLAGLQVPEPQRVVIRSRDGPEPIGRYRHSLRNALARKRLAAPTSRLADRRKSIVASLESTARYKYMCYVVGGERGRNRRNETALLNLGQVS